MTRREACYFLGVSENASEEQIKRAYRYKAKLYHPDANPSDDTKEYYIKAQKSYEYLLSHPYVPQPTPQPQRQVKIFSSSAATKESYRKQKERVSEREKIEKWDKEYKKDKREASRARLYGEEYAEAVSREEKSEEEKILDKIRAIWIAENIKRQIEQDKEQKEMRDRRKLYQAFMQQELRTEGSHGTDKG